jgi:ribitol-5-phosphate 2-dehydrogenase (NADP+) / D-ribitol-5-phosphate cytidylyltransferase
MVSHRSYGVNLLHGDVQPKSDRQEWLLSIQSTSARPRTTAVVLAGGTGQRVGLAIPKQLIKIAGKAVIEHTLAVFEQSEDIDDIIVLMAPGYVADVEKIVGKAGFAKVSSVIEGGLTRNETTERAIGALSEGLAEGEERHLLFHDAVRPLLSQRVIDDCVTALETYQAVDVAIPSSDTVIEVYTTGESSAARDGPRS